MHTVIAFHTERFITSPLKDQCKCHGQQYLKINPNEKDRLTKEHKKMLWLRLQQKANKTPPLSKTKVPSANRAPAELKACKSPMKKSKNKTHTAFKKDQPSTGDSDGQMDKETGDELVLRTTKWDKHTVRVLRMLKGKLRSEKAELGDDDSEKPSQLSYNKLSAGCSRRVAAGVFSEMLQLKTWDFVELNQDKSYGDIMVSPGLRFDEPPPTSSKQEPNYKNTQNLAHDYKFNEKASTIASQTPTTPDSPICSDEYTNIKQTMTKTKPPAAAGTATKTTASKKTRNNWYNGALYPKLVGAARKWKIETNKKMGCKQTFKAFCLYHKVPPTVLRRFNEKQHHKTNETIKLAGQGRPYSAEQLLMKPCSCQHHSCSHVIAGKITTINIVDTIGVWNAEQLEQHKNDKRTKFDTFVLYIMQNDCFLKPQSTKMESSAMTNTVHCIVLNVRHYFYLRILLKDKVTYYDSQKYTGRGGKKIKPSQTQAINKVLKVIGKHFHPEQSDIKYDHYVAEDIPKQENDIDCGVFSIYYADCNKNKMRIKPRLSKEDIECYRGTILKYIRQSK